ncbi:hypothetical protein T492DRAFT_981905 [Pavlovales sp. CCMP2436]|nr:hypothetical protein T492DRAFT_981905 [Pavlovales sp. CCMP2436]|mmetsp:Transcript_32372/g.75575  ORF Transcript_32372/g.75575 Transcript_32372/m.75575 type:complete len:122 (+) Transcript_32372:23-388(+)
MAQMATRSILVALALAMVTPAAAMRPALTGVRAARVGASCVRMEDKAPVPFPPAEVEAAYAAEVDAAIRRRFTTDYVPEEKRYVFGFVDEAETLNGRAAMMGFTLLLLIETVLGKGILQIF